MASKRIEKKRLHCTDKNGAGNEIDLDSSSSSAAWLSCSVMGHWSNIIDPANSEPCSCQCPNGSLGAGPWNSWAYSTNGPHPDVKSINALSFGRLGSCYSRLHGCIRRRFVTVSGNVASTGTERDG